MRRRDFMRSTAAAAAAGFLPGTPAVALEGGAAPALSDAFVVNGLEASVLSREYIQMQRSAGVDCCHSTMNGMRTFADAYNFVDANTDLVRVVRSVREMHAAKRDNKLALLLGWQSADAIAGGRGGPSDWWSTPPRTELRAYYELGLRVCGIAYQIANTFGGGAIDGHIGLSVAGRRLVEEIHKLRMVLDVGAHTGNQASLDALAISAGVPVICSHAGSRRFANSTRNLSDAVLEGIVRTGGVIGIPAISDFVIRGQEMAHVDPSPLGTVDDMLKHAHYIKTQFGAEHVGLGPDFTHGKTLNRDRAVFGADAMDSGPRRYVKGFESITELPNVTAGLQRLGWKPREIQGFMGGNWLRVYAKVWGA